MGGSPLPAVWVAVVVGLMGGQGRTSVCVSGACYPRVLSSK